MAHLFCLHAPELEHQKPTANTRVRITAPELIQRITRILRVRAGGSLMLFWKNKKITCKLLPFTNRPTFLELHCHSTEEITPLTPQIELVCGLTRRPAWEELVFTATQLSVTKIIPLLSEQADKRSCDEREISRWTKAAYAAAEQSKQTLIPIFARPQTLQEMKSYLASNQSLTLLCESGYPPLTQAYQCEELKQAQAIRIIIGPEGGLSLVEQEALCSSGARGTTLLPTVLRTVDAVEVGVGALRVLTAS